MEEVARKIRSVLISIKGKSDLFQLQRDYKLLIGEDIPFRKLGYSSIDKFIRNVPLLNVSQSPNGGLLVEAVTTNNTSHMVQLINKQKSTKKKLSGSGRLPSRHQQNRNFPPRYQNQQKPPRQQHTADQSWRAPYVGRARSRPHVHQIVVSVNGNQNTVPGGNTAQQRFVRSVTLSQSPPLTNSMNPVAESSSRKVPTRLTRSSSSPLANVNANNQPQFQSERSQEPQAAPPPALLPSPTVAATPQVKFSALTPNESRPRMRSHHSFAGYASPSPPPHQLPGMANPGPRHPAPTLNQSQIESLKFEGIAQFNNVSNNTQWRRSFSDSSSKNKIPVPNQEIVKEQIKEEIKEPFTPSPTSSASASGPLNELLTLARTHGLDDPIVRVLPRATKSRNANRLFDCTIKVDSQSYSSYPCDCMTAENAEAEAARQALADLSERYSANRQQRRLLVSTEQDVLTRVPPIIERHFHGIWATQLALDYEEQYNEQLPQHWLAFLGTLPTISVEPTVDNRFVLKLCKLGEKNITHSARTQVLNQHLSSDVSVPSNKIRLTEEGWVVQVTYVASTVEVWCRRIDNEDSDRYCDTVERMQKHYDSMGGNERATNVAAGGFYVVPFEGCWSRVRVLATGTHDVTCFFIDYGDEHVVPRSDMYMLQREFGREQAQAFVCRLSGLEELVNMPAATTRLENIAGRTYLAKPQIHEAQIDEFDGPAAISIVLYDYENGSDPEDDVFASDEEDNDNINRRLMRQITADSVPELVLNNINLVYVTHATDKGDVYVQPHCEAFTKLIELIAALDSIDFEAELPGMHISTTGTSNASPEEDARRLYLARWNQEGGDGNLYRARVIDRSPCGQYALLFYMDFGNAQIVQLNTPSPIYPLNRISEVLCAFPPLATRVRLDIELKLDPKTGEEAGFAERVMARMPSERPVLLKIIRTMVDADGISVPVCEMFKRTDSQNDFTSMTLALKYDRGENEDITVKTEDSNNNDKTTQLARKLERLKTIAADSVNKPVPSTGLLATPKLPGPGAFLDVRIPFAVNPWNFFVQPYSSANELRCLMEQLQELYGNGPVERVQLEDVVPGRIYASKHSDGSWYRTSVIKVINSGSISVFYCDFGYYANLTVKQLVPLDSSFLTLPYQAIKARLAGIQPRDTKWSMDDCHYFEQLVRDKTFVSVIVAVQQDELYKCDAVLVLRLIDTSTVNDVHIDKLLVEEGIAAQAPVN